MAEIRNYTFHDPQPMPLAHPLHKDFSLIGQVEMRHDEELKTGDLSADYLLSSLNGYHAISSKIGKLRKRAINR